MEKLARTIAKGLRTNSHCAVYDAALARVWPRNGVRRRKLIEQFAKKHGWQVGHYKDGFVAIFVRAATRIPPKERL